MWRVLGAMMIVITSACGARTPVGGGGEACGSRHGCFLVGGYTVQGFKTWEWDGANWTNMDPSRAPPPRGTATTGVFGDAIVLFGGWDIADAKITVFDDTWVWNGGCWNLQVPPHSPSARAWAAAATLDGNLVLFGGEHIVAETPEVVFGETWTWNGIDWTEQHPAHSPSARTRAVAATSNGVVVLFGGETELEGPKFNETWTWDGTDWTERSPATSPPARGQAMVAALGGSMVIFGGCARHLDGTCDELGDTWIWDGTSWTESHAEPSPPPRADALFASDGHVIWLYGGQGVTELFTDTWSFDGATWTRIETTTTSPADTREAAFQCLE
jgi:N-acetylneuraminic acid mutarotase